MRPLVCLLLTALLTSGSVPTWSQATPAPSHQGTWPLTPRPAVARGFAPPSSPWGAGHRGADLLGRPGQRVVAALAGTVTFAGRLAGRGVVVIDHGQVRTTYEPVSAAVRPGQAIDRGEPIGTLQRASSHCLPRACLHWGLLRGGTYVDPLTLVGAGPVRLLPLGRGTTASLRASGAARDALARGPAAAPAAGRFPVRHAWFGAPRSR